MGQVQSPTAPRSEFTPALCTMTQAKRPLLLLFKLLIIWYYWRNSTGATLPSSASPPHTAQPPPAAFHPWALVLWGWARAGISAVSTAGHTTLPSPGLQQTAQGVCSEPRLLLACSWLREAAPEQGLLWISPTLPSAGPEGAAAEWNCILHSKCWGLRTGPSTGTAPLLVDMVWLNLPSPVSLPLLDLSQPRI